MPPASPAFASHALAHAAAATHWPSLPAAAQAQAADLVLDTLAIIAAAAPHPGHKALAHSLAMDSGPATAIGTSLRLAVPSAALLNGAATTVLQWQDGHRLARGHPASHLVPALLALAEPMAAPADAVMAAFVAGYEVGTRIGMALGGMADGLHDAGTWGVIGAAAGAAHLLSGGDPGTIARAIDGAATTTLLPWSSTVVTGATMHHLAIGQGAATAVQVARAATAGLTGIPDTLERFFGPRTGAAFSPPALTAGLDGHGQWAEFQLMSGYIKWHQACAHASGAADAMAQLLARNTAANTAANIAALHVESYARGLAYNTDTPANDLAARFSLKAILAALALGRPLDDALLASPDMQALMARITVTHDPTLDPHYPMGRPARLTLTRAEGGIDQAFVLHPRGDTARPLTPAERADKVARALAMGLGEAAVPLVLASFRAWLAGAPLAPLLAALASPA
jgi:2-methylcitrate dehydratase PrpD